MKQGAANSTRFIQAACVLKNDCSILKGAKKNNAECNLSPHTSTDSVQHSIHIQYIWDL